MSLVNSLIKEGWLKTERIIKAFQKIKRRDFLPDDIKNFAELNEALLIGSGQTISQPLVVAFMLELLQPKPGDKILDIGSGSGWTTALLAEIVGEKGRVVSIEIIPELKKFGEKNITRYNFIEKGIVNLICADGSNGYKKESPFNGILSSAAGEKVPSAWKEQLKNKGRIVAPINSSIWLLIKNPSPSFRLPSVPSSVFSQQAEQKQGFKEIEYPGFAFVPLVTK